MRLTRDIRTEIAVAVIGHAFNDRKSAFDARRLDLGKRAYEHIFPKKMRDALAALGKVEGSEAFILKGERKFRVNAGGYRVTLKAEDVVFSRSHNEYNSVGDITDDTLISEIQSLVTEYEAFESERSIKYREVYGALESFNSDKVLAQTWPDIMPLAKPVLDKYIPAGINAVPALVISNLNASLGLPPETETLAEAA